MKGQCPLGSMASALKHINQPVFLLTHQDYFCIAYLQRSEPRMWHLDKEYWQRVKESVSFENFTLMKPHDTVWVICTEGTLKIRILHKFNHSMFSQKNTSDKAIPKMSSSSLGLLHSLGPYYTAIWEDIAQLVPFNFPLSSLKLLQRIVGGFLFLFF